jgi:hypothetical protein
MYRKWPDPWWGTEGQGRNKKEVQRKNMLGLSWLLWKKLKVTGNEQAGASVYEIVEESDNDPNSLTLNKTKESLISLIRTNLPTERGFYGCLSSIPYHCQINFEHKQTLQLNYPLHLRNYSWRDHLTFVRPQTKSMYAVHHVQLSLSYLSTSNVKLRYFSKLINKLRVSWTRDIILVIQWLTQMPKLKSV